MGPTHELALLCRRACELFGTAGAVLYLRDRDGLLARTVAGELVAPLAGERLEAEAPRLAAGGPLLHRGLAAHALPLTDHANLLGVLLLVATDAAVLGAIRPEATVAFADVAALVVHAALVEEAIEERGRRLETVHEEMHDTLRSAVHDLRAPLVNVQGFAGVLEEQVGVLAGLMPGGVPPAIKGEIEDALGFIRSSVLRMEWLIRSLLEVSRARTVPLVVEDIDMDVLVASVIASFRHRLTTDNIALITQPLPPARGDTLRLGQVFANLLDNAIKFMGRGRVREVEIGGVVADGGPIFFVRDTGVGIAPEHQDKVFRMFRRVPGTGGIEGEGVGLALAKQVVERHGGRVWVESKPGAGSRFYFSLRVHALQEVAASTT